MRNRTRLTATVLLVALLLSLLAGCGQKPDPVIPNKDSGVTPNAPQFSLGELPAEQKLQSLPSKAPGGGTKEYTVMLYMVGSDLESNPDGGCASADIEEIMNSGLDTSRVNFLIYTGGARYWHNGVPSDRNVIYQLVSDGLEPVASTQTPANMGDPATFLDFLNFSYQNYPARHYGMICWDHGGGPMGGYGVDELFSPDRLYLQEMTAAFEASPAASQKLDFLGFDACLMATMETAEMAAPYANYLIASQENEPGIGWDYGFLAALNATSDTASIARDILRTYEDSMEIYQIYFGYKPGYTLASMDLSRLSGVRSAADQLFGKMADGVKGGSYSAIAQARNKTLRFAQTAQDPFDVVDMGHMAAQLQNLYGSEVSGLRKAISGLVTGQVSNIDGTTGLSVYYPYDSKATYTDVGQYFYQDLTDCTGYERFIASFTDYWINGEPAASYTEHEVSAPEVTVPTEPAPTEPVPPATTAPAAPPAPQFTGASLQLSAEQLQSLSEVTFTVFRASTDRSSGQTVYIPVLSQIPLTPDSTGKVSLPQNQELVVLKTDESDAGILWPSVQLSVGGGVRYISNAGYLTTSNDVAGAQQISMQFAPGRTARMIPYIVNASADAAGRSEPDLAQWECIANRYVTLFPTCNNAGNLTAYTSWDDSGDEYYEILSYSQEFWLEQVPMTSLQEQFFVQIILTDTQGNTYASNVTAYYNGNTYAAYEQYGVVYHIYSDHAEVVGYTGTGGEVFIADEVSGRKVTVIAPEAFYYNRDITYVYLPKHLETIGERAFANCRNLTGVYMTGSVRTIRSEAFAKSGLLNISLPEGVQRIEAAAFSGTPIPTLSIPASVSYLGAGVFADCTNLIGVLVAGDPNGRSPYFKAVETILLTADGKELVQAPLGGSTTLRIPAGVEVIRSGAVRGSESLSEVVFPEGLKEIGSYAFYDTVNLQSLTLPESLEVIGHSAFGQFGVAVNTASPVTTVEIGPNVRQIGYDAFDAFPIGRFTVSGSNRHYSAVGGHLLNQSGTVFVHAAYTATGTLHIPAGVNHMAFHSLWLCDGITGLVLPDSVVSMDRHMGLPDGMKTLSVGKGLTRWDNISDAYYLDDVQINAMNPNFIRHMDCIYSRDLTTLYACLSKEAVLQVADTTLYIEETAFAPATGYNDTLTEIRLPASVVYLSGEMFKNCRALQSVVIHEDNQNYAAYDGLVYTKNGVSLILCPQGKTGTVSLRIGTATVWRYAFAGQLQASRIVIPAGVTTIRKGNFISYRKEALDLQLPDTLEHIYPDMLRSPSGYVVTCPAGSAADAFARSRGAEVKN